MSENKVTLKLNFNGTLLSDFLLYDNLFASYRDCDNHIANICLREGEREKGRKGRKDGSTLQFLESSSFRTAKIIAFNK